MSHENDIKKLIEDHGRRLQKLKEQQALKGSSTDPSISLEIEDIEAEIEKLQLKLDEIETKAQIEGGTDTLPTHDATLQKSHKKTIIEKLVSIVRDPIWQAIGAVVAGLACCVSILSCPFPKTLLPPSHTPTSTPTPTPITIIHSGTVYDKHSNQVIPYAEVIIRLPGRPPIVETTDVFGGYILTINKVSDGLNGKLEVNAKDYERYNQNLTLHRDDQNIHEIYLTRLLPPISTPTPRPIPACGVEAASVTFKQVLAQDSELTRKLGVRREIPFECMLGAYQAFDNGFMIWNGVAPVMNIYALFTTGSSWEAFNNTSYKVDKPLESCEAEPPEGRYQPIKGFGGVWCENQEVREGLGYATMEEEGDRDLPFQNFEGGWLVLIGDTVYAFIKSGDGLNGTWKSIRLFDYKKISLESQSELVSPETNLGLGPGIEYLPDRSLPEPYLGPDPSSGIPLSDVPFDTGWKASTQCQYLPDRPTRIQLDTNISNPLSVYLLFQAGWGFEKYKDANIGQVSLSFSDGNSFDVPLTLGLNIRDWADRPDVAVTTVSSSTLRLAREGIAPDETPGRMDILTIDVPNNYWQSTLESIQISDTTDATTGVDPCIHLLAVTVRYSRQLSQ